MLFWGRYIKMSADGKLQAVHSMSRGFRLHQAEAGKGKDRFLNAKPLMYQEACLKGD